MFAVTRGLFSRVKIAVVTLSLIALSGCSYLGWDDYFQADTIAPLVGYLPVVEPQTLWSTQATSGDRGQYARFEMAQEQGIIYTAGARGTVAAHKADTGQRLWKVQVADSLATGVGIGQNVLVVANSDGEVFAVDKDFGKKLWQAKVNSEVLAPPAVGSGVVAVPSQDGKLTTFRLETGEKLWVYDRDTPPLSLRGTSSPIVDNGRIFYGLATGRFVALDAETGKTLWEHRIGVPAGQTELQRLVDIDADPVLFGDMLFVGSYQGTLTAIHAPTGRVMWRKEMSVAAGMKVQHHMMIVVDSEDAVYALRPQDGALLWKSRLLEGRIITAPGVLPAFTLVGDRGGYLHVLSNASGRLVGRYAVDSEGILARPITMGERIHLLSRSGELFAFELKLIDHSKELEEAEANNAAE